MEGYQYEVAFWLAKFAEKMDQEKQSKKKLLENSKSLDISNQVINEHFVSGLLTDLLNLQFILEEYPKEFGLHIYSTVEDDSWLIQHRK